MDPLVSVIVPAYNADKYIEECLDSLIQQTYKNLQIIVIDDGSVDKTPEILDMYAQKDSRIEVVHKKNEGVSIARNIALDMAKGEYVHFCDADDWVSLDAYETVVKKMHMYEVDFIALNSYIHKEDDEPKFRTNLLPEGKYNKLAMLRYGCGVIGKNNRMVTCFLCVNDKVFKRELFFTKEGIPIRFKEGMKYLEDGLFFINVLENVKKGYYEKKGFYHRRMHEESAMGRLDIEKLSEQMLNGYVDLLNSEMSKNSFIVEHYIQNAYFRAALHYCRLCFEQELDDIAIRIKERFAGNQKFLQQYCEMYETIKGESERTI